MDNQVKTVIEFFCSLDIPLIPCFGIRDGCCSCKRGIDCPSPGKHPLMGRWQMIASTDPQKVLSWFTKPNKPINLAISTGRRSSITGKFLVAADGDLPNHPFMARLRKTNSTVTQRTGGGGDHALYWSNIPVKNSCQLVEDKIDIRGTGGILVIAPSQHKSGKKYEFTCDLTQTKIQDVPEFLAKKMKISIAKRSQQAKETSKKTKKNTSESFVSWQSLSINVIRDRMGLGSLIPQGVRNVVMHRLLSSDRSRGASTKSELMGLAKKYLGFFEDPESFQAEIEGIVKSVLKYPVYNNCFEQVNRFYICWLAKNGYKATHPLEVLEKFDSQFFGSLEKDPKSMVSLKEISSYREKWLKNHGLLRFATYKSQLLAKKLISLGFTKKRTNKKNLWGVKLPLEKSLKTKKMEELSMKELSNKGPLIEVDYQGKKVKAELISSAVPVKEHSREHLYLGRTGYDYNKNLISLLAKMTDSQRTEHSENRLVLDKNLTEAWINLLKPNDIIGVRCHRYRFDAVVGDGIRVAKVSHVEGKPGQFKDIEDPEVLSLPQLDFARELILLDILWRDGKPYGEPDMKDMTVVLLQDIEEPSKPKKVKKKT